MNKIVKMVFGSSLYGTQTPDSDTDYKGVYLPSIDERILGTTENVKKFGTKPDDAGNMKNLLPSADVIPGAWNFLS